MLEFRLYDFELEGRWYVLLPKMGGSQMAIIKKRLLSKGFGVSGDERIAARRGGQVIHVDPAGVCWSADDPSDAIAPVLPDILASPKEVIPAREILSRYVRVRKVAVSSTVRFSTRIESSSSWKTLRKRKESGLTPDERTVAISIFRASRGGCRLLTDFPTDDSRVRIVGKRQYYESILSSEEAAATLRPVDSSSSRNSYLPINSVMHFESVTLPPTSEQNRLIEELGEWCLLTPTNSRKL